MRVATDTGGTFTDCIFLHHGKLEIVKVPSLPKNPAAAISETLRKVRSKLDPSSVASLDLVCGTTVGTNALLERRGGRVLLITTKGFEDVLEIGRQARPELYNLEAVKPPPLVPGNLRFGLSERVTAAGEVLESVDEIELSALVE